MQGDDVKRFCGKCRLYVWDFAALTTEEARALLIETEGRLCARIFTREDGTVLTKDCPAGIAKQRRKRGAGIAAAAALLGGAATFAAAQQQPEECALAIETDDEPPRPLPVSPAPIFSDNPRGQMLGGKISVPRTPPPSNGSGQMKNVSGKKKQPL
jgi:hypothetical protein